MDSSPIRALPQNYASALRKSIANVLSTNVALETFAQLVDGLPTLEVALDRLGDIAMSHPIDGHKELCPGALDKAMELRAALDVDSIELPSNVLNAFQHSPMGSHQFKLRFIELVAIAVHQIAVSLYNHIEPLHDIKTTEGLAIPVVAAWRPPTDPQRDAELGIVHQVRPPTLFTHASFEQASRYPDGLADLVGFWAENRILGGVALFDRSRNWRENEEGDNEPNIWYRSDSSKVTYRLVQLLDSQQDALIELFTCNHPKELSILPILPDRKNLVRKDWADWVWKRKIYRESWTRPEGYENKDMYRRAKNAGRCRRGSFHYPEQYTGEKKEPRPYEGPELNLPSIPGTNIPDLSRLHEFVTEDDAIEQQYRERLRRNRRKEESSNE